MDQSSVDHDDEEGIVDLSDAVIDPNAVMVKTMNTSLIAMAIPVAFFAVSGCVEDVTVAVVAVEAV